MRKRGFIVLIATVPIWAFALMYGWYFEKSKSLAGGWYFADLPEPLLLEGAGLAIVILTLLALCLLVVDSISWFRHGRNDRTNKIN